MAEKHKRPHAIVVPLPHQGHINPAISLALKLALKGIKVTFLNLEFVHHMISKSYDNKTTDLFSEARESGLDIRSATIGDGFPLEFDRVLHLEEFYVSMLRDFPARVDEFVGKTIKSDPGVVHFLVADTLYAWPAAVAKKYNLVNVSLWTEPALVFSLVYHSGLLKEHGHYPLKDNIEEEVNYVPGVGSVNTRDFMPYLKESDFKTSSHTIVFSSFEEVVKADFILHNTVQELEFETVSALNKYQPNYAVGPINFSRSLATYNVKKSLLSESDCTQWLNSKLPGSVLYVSLGSLAQTSNEVIEEIGYGLLLSGVNFVWVARHGVSGSADTNGLPVGFKDEVKDKGLIIPWSNQVSVLSNSSVGGFLTHCGWNSVLESVWCGVPMICYPIEFDQPMNRKLVVDDWKIGVNLRDGTSPVDRNEVAKKIKYLMSGPSSKRLKQEASKVMEKLHNAVEIGGSSEKNFDQFVGDLKEKIYARTS